MSKKIIGIAAAIAVVVIIVLVALNKPSQNQDSAILDRAIDATEEQSAADAQAQAALQSDTTAVDTTITR